MSKRKEIPDVMSQLQGLGTPAPTSPPATAAPVTPVPRETARPRPTKNRTPKSRLIGRATYDIGVDLKEAIRRESIDLGIPASQLAKYLLLYAWDFYVNGDIPAPALLRSDSPKFRNTIDFGE
ncbi:MAG TPA: hypothetical protein EYH05_08935 [Anaerolineae bacterium]|nr:hypothetical protein [Anaerolineae bacterium]